MWPINTIHFKGMLQYSAVTRKAFPVIFTSNNVMPYMKFTFRKIHVRAIKSVMISAYAEFKGARTMQ